MDLPPTQLARARRGDRDALAAIVRHYQDRVYAVCVALAGSDAEDCAQDALLKVLAAVHRFDPARGPSLGAWVMTITRRVCIDRSRAARVARYTDRQIDAFAAPGGDAADRVRQALVRRAVLDLPDEHRVVMVLRVWGELAYEEIAELEGIPIGTVRSRLARARDALRATLSPALTSLLEVHDDVG